jgi:DNA-binding NarL/FixJ family response regulator
MHEQESVVAGVLRAGARGCVLKSDPASHLTAAIEALSRGKTYFSPVISETVLDYFVQQNDGASRASVLTHREREVIQVIAEGNINKQVAYMLDISTKTVETRPAALMSKLKLRSTAELVLYAVRNNIVQA